MPLCVTSSRGWSLVAPVVSGGCGDFKQGRKQAAVTVFADIQLLSHPESRALSVPVKTMLHIHEGRRSPEERMKEFIGILWNAVKSLTLQVNLSIRITMALQLTIFCNFSIFNSDIIFLSTFPWSVLSLVHWCTMFITDNNFRSLSCVSYTLYHIYGTVCFLQSKLC